MTDIAKNIEILATFAVCKGLIDARDRIFCRNALLALFRLDSPSTVEITDADIPDTIPALLDEMTNSAVKLDLCEDLASARVLFDNQICGCVMMPPSQIEERFLNIWNNEGIKPATKWFYQLCEQSNYIRTADIARNIQWDTPTEYGAMTVTVNLTKPEKDPREIAALGKRPAVGFPACQLCIENTGYAGRLDFQPKKTLRTVPLTLNGKEWRFQYSPYVYYNEHCIVLSIDHVPMHISRATFVQLFDFLDQFPHYFIGSNAGLPVVGGSILNHEHYQGGRYTLPMENATVLFRLRHPDYPVDIEAIRWPLAGLRLRGKDRESITNLAELVLNHWQNYTDESADIVAYTNAPHNTITPVARRKGDEYELDIVFRNNRTSEEHPMGIFHPHEQLHHIKKENIGLIEMMGLFILPGRLDSELKAAAKVLTGKTTLEEAQNDELLSKHLSWLTGLKAKNKTIKSEKKAMSLLCESVGEICVELLRDAGVFKETDAGRAAYLKFLSAIGLEVL